MKKKKFARLRAWNRKRNYLMKDVKYYICLYIEKILWDKSKKTTIHLDSVQSILLIRNEGKIGDVIVDTAIIELLSKNGYVIDVLVAETNKEILVHNPHIRNIYIANNTNLEDFMKKRHHNVSKRVIEELKENNYDLIIDPSMFNVPRHRLRLLKEISAKNVISFNKANWLNHYSQSIEFNYNSNHIKNSYEKLIEQFNIKNSEINYNIYYPSEIDDEIKIYLDSLPQKHKNIIINMFAGSSERCLSLVQIREISEKLNNLYKNINIIILDYKNIISSDDLKSVNIYNPPTLQHTISLISKADLVISPDTSIVHIAATYQCPIISIYRDAIHNNTLWGPGYSNSIQLFTSYAKTYEDEHLIKQIVEASNKFL